jgi:hypothetical protein
MDHQLEVAYLFSGNVVVILDGKVIRNTSNPEMIYDFEVEGKFCKLKIAYEE